MVTRKSATVANPPFSVRIDPDVRRRAEIALDAMGLSLGGFINMAVATAARGDVNPMDFMRPGRKTLAAIKELQDGGGKSFTSIDALIADLHADD
jgi:DNA-damage-inducible protein J